METQIRPLSKVHFVSLGCPKNLVDSQVMLGKLQDDRYVLSEDAEQADVIIVNTCSFIESAKEESIDTILEMAEMKESGQCKALVVSGCLPQRYSKQLEEELPEIDLMIGTGQYHRITEFLNEYQEITNQGADLPRRTYIDFPAFIHTEKDARLLTGPRYTGYLKLSEGCNRRCTFCIIPKLRGDVRSRTILSLVEEAKKMVASGARELNLVAQDLTHYGIDNGYQENLEKLLPELCKVEGLDWIRLHYVYPDNFSDELVDIFAREKKIVKYLDMPIQHTSDRVLRLMGRQLRKDRLFSLIRELRERVPEVVFRTSIIVGFPGETEEDFEELCKDLKTLALDYVGVFPYSKEEDTAAIKLKDHLPLAVKKRRLNKINDILSQIALEKKERLLGQTVEVMVEGPSQETEFLIQSRMPTQAESIDGHILINDLGDLEGVMSGDFLRVEITEIMGNDFLGRVVQRA